VTWGALAGLAWAAWQACWAALLWRDLRGKEGRVRKRLKNGGLG
jgi:hypothetical protein